MPGALAAPPASRPSRGWQTLRGAAPGSPQSLGARPERPLSHPRWRGTGRGCRPRARAIPEGWSGLTSSSITDRRLDQAMGAVARALTDPSVDRQSLGGTLTLAYIPDEDQHRHRVTTLDMRWSKKDLMETLEFWIDVFLRDRAAAELKQSRPHHRFRVAEYQDYLRVHDLREGNGRTFRQIADHLWPGAEGAPEKRARDYYNNGRALILNPPLMPKTRRSSSYDSPVQKPGPD